MKTVALIAAAIAGAAAAPVAFDAKVDPLVHTQVASEGNADIFVRMGNSIHLDLEGTEFASRGARARFVFESMKARMYENHAPIHKLLAEHAGEFAHVKSFWITNSVYIEDANPKLIELLSKRADVEGIYGNEEHPLERPIVGESLPRVNNVEWGIDRINAPDVWASGNTGEGIVIATIDTGARHTHEALVDTYRGNNGDGTFDHDYNFFEGYGGAPVDNNGHGTHTTGTVAGTHGIGVAPGAKWIAAIGCRGWSCSTLDLTRSAEWMVCPTRLNGDDEDCSKAPHVINNSWGGGQNDFWYYDYVEAWQAAGIIPVFSQGNSGSSCGSANSPGDYDNVIGVGASNIQDSLAYFSSRGPARSGLMKPDITGPGENVRSASHTSDTGYTTMSGTSMSGPHVAGGVALLLNSAENNVMGYAEVYNSLMMGATTDVNPDKECGGIPADEFPNNNWGYGLMDLCASTGSCGSKSNVSA